VWGIYFFIKLRNSSSYKATASLLSLVVTSNILQLLVSIVAHHIVSRRGGCLVGIFTSIGIIGGVVVMIWSFGPIILFLFLREKYKLEVGNKGTQ
jgi:Fe2+ transport system protein B